MTKPLRDRLMNPIFGAVLRPIRAFLAREAASGLVLLACAVGALAWVNLGGAASYHAVFSYPLTIGAGGAVVRFAVHDLVNDGLMTLFFFVVGMEIKRELVLGELRSPAQAALPAVAAAGGMVVPAAIFLAFNRGGPGAAGWGIPMATDIAFSIGVLTLLRSRVPHALLVFVTALAIFDDIGGILVIALFYGHGLDGTWLAAGGVISLAAVTMGRGHVGSGLAWLATGAALWFALHGGGVHPTIAGVIVGLSIPARTRGHPRAALEALSGHSARLLERPPDEKLDGEALLAIEGKLEDLQAPLDRLVRLLHPWVAFGIVPAFALANSGVDLRQLDASQLTGGVAVGTAVALVAGKALGIFTFTLVAVKVGPARVPGGVSKAKLAGASVVAGIGFTVALFIAGLAFTGRPELLDQAKVGILAGSLLAGVLGASILRATARLGE